MLIGDRICLGPVLQGDAPLLFNWLNDVQLSRSNGPYRPTDQTKFDAWIAGLGSDPSRVVFTIRQKQGLRLIGYIQLTNIQPVHRTAELGILIGGAADRSQGYGQEAVSLAMDFCWRDLNLQRLTLFVVGDNPRAIRTYLKTGFVIEGILRRGAYVDGRHCDISVMGALRDADAI